MVVEPEVPVHGVVPAEGGKILERPFRVQAGSTPNSRNLGRKIPLFTRQKLAQAYPALFRSGNRWDRGDTRSPTRGQHGGE